MTTRLQFDIPDFSVPFWATNANRTLDPDDTLLDPVPIVKEEGFELSQRPPARVVNWLHHYVTEWLRSVSPVPIANWLPSSDAGAADIDGVVFAPSASDEGDWTVASGTAVYRDNFGVSWGGAGTLNSAANRGAFTIDTSYPAIFGTVNGLEYNSTGSTYVEVADVTIGGGFTGGVIAMDSRYPDNDRTIVIDANGRCRIAASGVAGAWTAPTTPPNLGATLKNIGRVIHAGSGKWFAARQAVTGQHLSVSTDDGDVWTTKTLPPFTSSDVTAIAYDPTTERLVACGVTSGVAAIYYSDDDGATWTASNYTGMGTSNGNGDVYSCGGSMWIAVGSGRVLLSIDNAETWVLAEMYNASLGGSSGPYFLMSDGRKLVAVGESGKNIRSLAYPDFR